LSTEFDNNEKEINEVGTLLKQREGNLGELFGVTRQVAGDTANDGAVHHQRAVPRP
jgi:biopolymer transport protein ExbB